MDPPRGNYTQWSKSVREKQIPCDFTYMWNQKNNINEQTQLKHAWIQRTSIAGGEQGFGTGWKRCKGWEAHIGNDKVVEESK